MTTLRVRAIVGATTAEGPGRRAALWVQGCSIRCPGCFNPHMWSSNGGREMDVDEVVTTVLTDPTVEGVTFLGGEPFDQAPALALVADHVQRQSLSVMTFTGYWLEDLLTGSIPGSTELLAVTDLLVDGPFDASQPDHLRPWLGSRNQRFHHLTSRYASLGDMEHAGPDRLEVRVSPSGSVFVNGQTRPGVLPEFVHDLGLRPARRSER